MYGEGQFEPTKGTTVAMHVIYAPYSFGVCFRDLLVFVFDVQALGKYLKRNMSSASGRKLRQSTYDAVVKLCEDKDNTVFIVSGLNDKGLMHVSKHSNGRVG